jgi:hypothetical protein
MATRHSCALSREPGHFRSLFLHSRKRIFKLSSAGAKFGRPVPTNQVLAV